ncbi:MAG: DNA mismatch repair protein MutL, partial [Opitutaceae bacterium]|nr:DNA mismatch repair protein MutL [Opitutaceae bacterium]
DLLHNHYALYETPAGLVLMDRRAAGERIWFERLQAEYRAGRPPTQKLLFPVPLEFDPVSSSCLLDRIEFFSEHGVEIAEFGRNFFRIEAIPVWMEPADAAPHVRELVANLRDGALHGANLDLAREALARLSASKAVNLGRAPDADELRRLPDRLFACRNPMTSPSGKPTPVEIPLSEIARRLQR